MKRVVLAGVGAALACAGIGGWWVVAHAAEKGSGAAHARVVADTMRLINPGVRVKVEVLNASGERGLARRATQYLRERGFDVVSVGNAKERQDSSTVIDRTGHPDWAVQAARAVGPSRMQAHADLSRYLDLTLVLGSTFRAPALILYP